MPGKGNEVAPAPAPAAGGLRLRARWGDGPGELGHRVEPESAAEGPMAVLAAPGGGAWLLDQVNGRALRLDGAGQVVGQVPASETTQDLASGPRGRLVLLDRIGQAEVVVRDAGGALVARLPVVGGPIEEGGAVTGVFADETGVYLEREHTDVVRIAGPDGQPDASRPVLPGRPGRDGAAFVRVALARRGGRALVVTVFEHGGARRWEREVLFPRGILQVLLLDTDRRGHVVVGAEVAGEAAGPPYPLGDLATLVVRLALADGAEQGRLTLPAQTGVEESFRPLAVTDGGEVLQLLPGPDGATLTAHAFP